MTSLFKMSDPIVREPICSVEYCPAPTRAEWHECLVCKDNHIQHHHVEGRGGKKKERTKDPKRVVPLCDPHHKKISENDWNDAILNQDIGGAARTYRIWDVHNNTIHESEPWWMQPEQAIASERDDIQKSGALIKLPALGVRLYDGKFVRFTDTSLELDQRLPFDGWVAVCKTIGRMTRSVGFWAGDLVNFGEDTYGEQSSQALDVLGLQPETIGNMARVARLIPPARRRGAVSFSVHVEVAKLDAPEQERVLALAETAELSARQVRELVQGGYVERETCVCPVCTNEHRKRKLNA